MNIINKDLNNLLIVSITPYFLEKSGSWFTENLRKILDSRHTQSFFQDNVVFLTKDHSYNFSQFLRQLDEMGYEKVFKVSEPGEFSQKGGIVDVFPINMKNAVRLDFLGNEIDGIKILDIEIENEKKIKDILIKRLKSQKLFSELKGLKSGDCLVHLDHGIGKFLEITNFNLIGDEAQKYYILEYANEDKLYVPVGLERKLSKYVGFTDPKISRLGSTTWQKTKKLVKEEVEKLAKDLLFIYSQKEIASRPAYITDEELEFQLRAGFDYEETPDQLQAILDIKKDLSKERPMDRVICGDVGFGKTEIAMRSALLAVSNNRQTAIICPTTILANQHYNSFKKRFSAIGGSASGGKNPLIKVSLLSRLQNKNEQKKIIKDLKDGRIDILIGTHRLLSKDIVFKNLQLLIIDDEQRFGVKQKEKLRQTNPSLDILSLSATPIPRTIYLALSSFKNISLIQTPPEGRQAVLTQVLPYNEKIIKKAINFELNRKGQIYYLHNKIESIKKAKLKIKKLCKRAKIGIIHGRIPKKQLLKIMDDFQKEKTNVLVATTIIENGLDLPKVNTIIIEDAVRLGLSQAHQIRGRVGRSHTKSFAYFLYPPKSLTPMVKERLTALEDAKELGSGYKIAIKDLELRGAGNILGKEQSGAINKIGLNLYSQVLSEAVEKLRN